MVDEGDALMLQPTPEVQSLLAQDLGTPTMPCLLQCHTAVVLSVRMCTGLPLMDVRKAFNTMVRPQLQQIYVETRVR